MSRVPGGVGPQKNFGEYLAYGTTDKPSFGNYGNIFENMNHPSDGIASNTDRTHCPVPIPSEHDDFSFKCAYVESFGVAPFLYSVDGFFGYAAK